MQRLAVLVMAGVAVAGCGSRSSTPAGYAGDDARDFVKKHRAELEAEIDTGSGPRLYDLAIIGDCQDVPSMGRRLSKNREKLFAPGDTTRVGGEEAPAAPTPGAMPPSDDVVAERVVRFLSDARDLRCLNLDLSRQRMFAAGTRHVGPRRAPTTNRGGTP